MVLWGDFRAEAVYKDPRFFSLTKIINEVDKIVDDVVPSTVQKYFAYIISFTFHKNLRAVCNYYQYHFTME